MKISETIPEQRSILESCQAWYTPGREVLQNLSRLESNRSTKSL